MGSDFGGGCPLSSAPNPLELPGVPPTLWSVLRAAAGGERIALVGGAVRDWLLHHQHLDPWRGLVDLDLVIEEGKGEAEGEGALDPTRPARPSPAWRFVERIAAATDQVTVRDARPHGRYGTVELELELLPPSLDGGPTPAPMRLLLDVASARGETYPTPADNPVVFFGALEDDLARRDLTINAMAMDLTTGALLDPHGGQDDLAQRRLCFLHPASLRDDPTRLVRAARYAARLGFPLAAESESQALSTLASWPWVWRPGDPPHRAPAALGTRLRREMELLLERENWRIALDRLQAWGGLVLLDAALQADRRWPRRLHWARRLGVPRIVALIAVAPDPLALAERLQLPHRHHRLLEAFSHLRQALARETGGAGGGAGTAWSWCQRLEAPGGSPEAVALALACGLGPRRPLLRWLLRWRHLRSERSAEELMAAGVPRGPELGDALRRCRQERLNQERP